MSDKTWREQWEEHDQKATSIINKYWRWRRRTWRDFADYGEHLYQMGKIDGARDIIRVIDKCEEAGMLSYDSNISVVQLVETLNEHEWENNA